MARWIAGSGSGGSSVALPSAADFAYLRGVNTQGGGGSQHDPARVPGTLGTDYFYNSAGFYKFLRSRGHRLVRLDFLWERVQPTLNGPLDATKLAELKAAVQRAADAGLLVLLDMKNYGRYWQANDTQIQFGAGLTSAHFADVWSKLATAFADQPAVVMWGLMNEPHDHPDYPTTFTASGTVNDFTSTVESWVGAGGTTASWSGGALVGTEANSGAGTQIVTLESPQGSGAGTYSYPVGSTLEIEVEVPTSTPGTLWQVRPAIVTTAFGLEYGPFTTVPKGATTTKVYMPVPAAVDGTDHRHLIVEFTGDGITGSTALVVKIHAVRVGTYVAAASTPWKDASQAAVTAIRATGDKRTIGVAGDDYSWTGGWVSINGAPWIADPANNIVYEAHQYFDHDNSGTYEDVTYASTNTAAVAAGFADVTARALTYLGNFTAWCKQYGVRGFISEVGWPNHESVDQWNAVGEAFYAAANAAGIGITYWGTGETLSSDYNQDAYKNSTTVPQAQTKVIEKASNLSAPAGGAATPPQFAHYFVWKTAGGNVNAAPRIGSGLPAVASGTASAVIQACINALTVSTGSRGASGGRIHIARPPEGETYFLNNELTITGWEGIANTDGVPQSQLAITGDGSTWLTQNTAGQNGIVIKNLASVFIQGLNIYCGANAKSCILGDKNGAGSEMSMWRSTLDNLFLSSNSTVAPALYLKNFFDVNAPTLTVQSSANHGIVLENDSITTNYGNSHFGFLRTNGGSAQPFAGLVVRSTNSNQFPNLLTFDNFECMGGYYGIYAKGMKFSTFLFVDIEGSPRPVYFDGEATNNETRHNSILSGYLLPSFGGTAITSTQRTGGNFFRSHIQSDSTAIPIADTSEFRPANSYDVDVVDATSAGRIAITNAANTPLILTRIDGTKLQHLPTGATVATPTAGDNTTRIATTAFVKAAVDATSGAAADRRVSFFEALGNSTSTTQTFPVNFQGTATTRAYATTNVYTRSRKLGFVSATTANARSGLLGNPQLSFTEATTLRFVFGLPSYSAAHGYAVGVTAFDDPAVVPSAQNSLVHLYADPGDTTWKIRGGAGVMGAAVDLGANFPVATSATDLYELTLSWAANAASFNYTLKRLNTGQTTQGTYNSLPTVSNTTAIKALAYNYASGAAASIDVSRVVVTTDY